MLGSLQRKRVRLDAAMLNLHAQMVEQRIVVLLPDRNDDLICFERFSVVLGEPRIKSPIIAKHARAALQLDTRHGSVPQDPPRSPAVNDSDPLGDGGLDLLRIRGHLVTLLQAHKLNAPGSKPQRGSGHVNGDVAASDDNDSLFHFGSVV